MGNVKGIENKDESEETYIYIYRQITTLQEIVPYRVNYERMSYNAEQSLQGKLKMDQTCLDNNTCGFAGVCSIINVKGEAVCTINIWTPIALVFIATFVVLVFVTILLYVDYRKRKPRGLSENEYCSLE